MRALFRFEKLDVWQAARRLNRRIYRVTKTFPIAERFALISQIRRASISVSSNIAEGSGRNSDRDFAHFLEVAYGSLMEVASQLYLAFDEEYLGEADLNDLLEEIRVEAAQLGALNRSLLVSGSKVAVRQPSTFAPGPSTPRHRPSTSP
ncbi:MAG TPA: four helix bundle protein [Chthoniobacteraceae bacterium]